MLHCIQVFVEAGSQLIAFFEGKQDAVTVLAMVHALVCAALGGDTATSLEVARGSVVVYIVFKIAGIDVRKLVDDLLQQGADVSFSKDGESDFMMAVREGVIQLCMIAALDLKELFTNLRTCLSAGSFWVWLMNKSARVRYAAFVSVPTHSGKHNLIC